MIYYEYLLSISFLHLNSTRRVYFSSSKKIEDEDTINEIETKIAKTNNLDYKNVHMLSFQLVRIVTPDKDTKINITENL